MTTGMLQDAIQVLPARSSSESGPRFRPYTSPNHTVTKGRYITSNDSRGYIPVYEYPVNGQWIMMDIDDGYILWTGIWKALGNSKVDIIKMIDSQPDITPLIRRVRGGDLKIQGTWMPYEVALKLSRRTAWAIRDDLIPLFGPTFPSTCLSPDHPGYGQVLGSGQGRRRNRQSAKQSSVVHMPQTRAPGNWHAAKGETAASHSSSPISPGPLHPIDLKKNDYPMDSSYASHMRQPVSSEIHMFPIHDTSKSMQSPKHDSYSHPPSSYRKLSTPGRMCLSLNIRTFSKQEKSSGAQPERGRSRHRLRRAQSVTDPLKSDVDIPDQLTTFPPPPPVPAGRPKVQRKNITSQQQPKSQQVQHTRQNANNNLKNQGREKFDTGPINPESTLSFGLSRSRSLSFHGPTERDPNFGRPYSSQSSRSSSRTSSRLSLVHESYLSTPNPWSKSSTWFQEDRIKGPASLTLPSDVVKPISRLAIPLPLPPVTINRLRRSNRERVPKGRGTDHFGSYMSASTSHSARRTQYRRPSRPPSPHPFSSRGSSRSSFSIPLERKSSFLPSSPGPRSALSSHHSSRPSSRSPVRYTPSPSPRTSFYTLPSEFQFRARPIPISILTTTTPPGSE